MTTLTAFVLGAVFGIVMLVSLLSWACWSVWKPTATIGREPFVLTADSREALMKAIQDDMQRRPPARN